MESYEILKNELLLVHHCCDHSPLRVEYIILSPCGRNKYTEAERRRNELFYKMTRRKDRPYKVLRISLIVLYLIFVISIAMCLGTITGDGFLLPGLIGYAGAAFLPLFTDELKDRISYKIPNKLFSRRIND